MILRLLRAKVKLGKHAAYTRLCQEKALPLMRAQPGFVSARIAPYQAHAPTDFTLISVWRDRASLAAWLGPRWEEAMILPGEADLLESLAVTHIDEAFQNVTQVWHELAARMRHEEQQAILDGLLTDAQWAAVREQVPPRRREGRPRSDDRRTLDGILYVLRSGCRWHDLPPQFGSAVTCWRRLRVWEAEGAWERIWRAYLATLDDRGKRLWARIHLDTTQPPHYPTRRMRHARQAEHRARDEARAGGYLGEPMPTGSEVGTPMAR